MNRFPLILRLVVLKVLLLAAAAGFAVYSVTAQGAETFQVAKTLVEDRKAVFATVESVDTVQARTRIGGTIAELSIDEGASVTEGQLVARVRDPKLQIKTESLDAKIRSLQSQLELAETELERARKLRQSGTIAQSRLDKAETEYQVVRRELASMRAEKKVIQEQQEEGAVYAPADGRVLAVPLTQGSVVLPGEQVATIAAKAYILRMQLPERHARFIAEGDTVQVAPRGLGASQAEAEGAEMRSGRIRQVYPEIRQGRVIADVAVEGLGDFFVGERVQVYVTTDRRETFVIPERFLFHRFGVAFVTLEKGIEAVVQPGLPAPGGIEILSGLQEGDVLVAPAAE